MEERRSILPEVTGSIPVAALGQPVIAQLEERLTVDQLVTCSNQVDGNSVTSGSQGLIAHVFFGVIAQWQSERLQFVWSGVRLTLAPLAETLWIMRGQEFDPPIGCAN